MIVRLTRRYRFSASHRLHAPALSEAENRDCTASATIRTATATITRSP